MSASLPISVSLAAIIDRWKALPDPTAQAYEQGAISTKPARQRCSNEEQRKASIFLPRRCRMRRTDDERIKLRDRKRVLGGSSALPDTMRHHYTEGERAVLCIVAFEVKRHGICDLSIDEIADRAGVGRTTVQNAMHEGRRLGHLLIKVRPQRGAKNLTNVVDIASVEWRTWIRRAPSAARGIGFKISKNVSTSESIDKTNTDSTKQHPRIKGAWRWGVRRNGSPTRFSAPPRGVADDI
jgi:hypothetical protein